jgi:hypothetical protein
LLDSAAFKDILGKACKTPAYKCDRDRYKQLLIDAVMDAGATPILRGLAHTEDIVNRMNFDRIESCEPSFGDLLKELRSKFNMWSND